MSGSAREQRGHAWRTSEAVEKKAAEGTALIQADHGPHEIGGVIMARQARKEKQRSEGSGYSTASSEGAAAQRQGGQG
jgi:hypothetical protein